VRSTRYPTLGRLRKTFGVVLHSPSVSLPDNAPLSASFDQRVVHGRGATRREPRRDRYRSTKGNGKSRQTPARSLTVPLVALAIMSRLSLSLETARSAPRMVSGGTRRNFLAKPTFESVQIIHFVGSHCHGLTPFR